MLVTVLLMTALTGVCQTNQITSAIEATFKNYVKENFGKYNQFREVIDVSLVDTFKLSSIKNNGIEVLEVGLNIEKSEENILNWFQKKAATYINKLRAKNRELEEPLQTLYEAIPNYAEARSALKKSLREVEGKDNYFIEYTIKVRMEMSGVKKVETFYAYIDKSSEIKIQALEMRVAFLPKEWRHLYENIDVFIEQSNIKVKCLGELKQIIESVGGKL